MLIGSVMKCLILGKDPNGPFFQFDIKKEFERMDDDKDGAIEIHEVEAIMLSQNQGKKKVLCFLNQTMNEFIYKTRQVLAQISFSMLPLCSPLKIINL